MSERGQTREQNRCFIRQNTLYNRCIVFGHNQTLTSLSKHLALWNLYNEAMVTPHNQIYLNFLYVIIWSALGFVNYFCERLCNCLGQLSSQLMGDLSGFSRVCPSRRSLYIFELHIFPIEQMFLRTLVLSLYVNITNNIYFIITPHTMMHFYVNFCNYNQCLELILVVNIPILKLKFVVTQHRI